MSKANIVLIFLMTRYLLIGHEERPSISDLRKRNFNSLISPRRCNGN